MRIRPAAVAGLVVLWVAALALWAQAALAQAPAETCRACHSREYDTWAMSAHARAAESAAFRALAGTATQGWGADGCTRCHAPRTSDDASTADGVSCQACHLIQRVDGVGNGAFRLAVDGVMRSARAGQAPHPTSASPLFSDSLFCAACHEQYHPTTGVALQSTYTEWLNSADAHGGKTCQVCHMAGTLSDHAFGAGAVDAAAKGDALGRAIDLQVRWPKAARAGSPLIIDVRLENTGAGHALPTGKPEGYEMWLEMTATAGGEALFTEALPYGVVYADSKGNNQPRVSSLDAASLFVDHRLFPDRPVQERFVFVVPTDVRGRVEIEVRLMYRRTPLWLSEQAGLPTAEAVVVRRASASLGVLEPLPTPTYVAPTPPATLRPTPTPAVGTVGVLEERGWLGPFLLVGGLVLIGVAAWALKARAV
ncbi:MAG: hypothetical protein H5T65_03310 [Chloroflexi bacterium]|nr:hypothetical protein [Chloroflexota bacterium]